MDIKLDTTDFTTTTNRLIGKLLSFEGETDAVAHEIVLTLTQQLMSESIKRAPFLEGHLQASHHYVIEKNPAGFGYVGTVFIPVNAPAAAYAIVRHETDYKLGPESLRKQAGQPEKVGKKYLERAFYENVDKVDNYIKARLTRFFKDGL